MRHKAKCRYQRDGCDCTAMLIVGYHLFEREASLSYAPGKPWNEPRHRLTVSFILFSESLGQHALFVDNRTPMKYEEQYNADYRNVQPLTHCQIAQANNEAAYI